jgi:glycosyltransferase involved in cell wall biosynthesis
MNIALDVSAVPEHVAGAGRYIVELARRLPGRNVGTTLVTRRSDAQRWRSWSPSATVVPISTPDHRERLAFEAWRLGTSAPARAADVWHAPHYTMPRRGPTPTVVTIHDLTFFTNPEWHERSKVAFFRRAIHYSAVHADALISVSAFTARQLDEFIPEHAPVVVAPHGVDLDRFTSDASRDDDLLRGYGLDPDRRFIFFVGTLEPRKGLEVLLDAFEYIARDDDSVELWLAGQSGWGLKDFDALLASHGAAARIRRLGFVDEGVLPALLRRASVVAYPSRGEGFGLPVLEAMACGAMVVTTEGTVMAEVAGDCALLVPVGDPTKLAEALTGALSSSSDVRREWGARARTRAEHFTWDYSLARHLEAYEVATAAAS